MSRRILFLVPALLCCLLLTAQNPGGVSKPELWFKTQPVGTDLRGNYHWKDFSGDSLRLNSYTDQGAEYGEEFKTTVVRFVNGYPALHMDKLLDYKFRNVQLKRTNLSQATLIGMFVPNSNYSKEYMLYGLYGRPGQGVWVGNDKVYHSRESGKTPFDYGEEIGMDLKYSSNDAEGNEAAYKRVAARIAAYYRSVLPSTSIWGERDRAVLTFGSIATSSDVNQNSTFSIPTSANNAFVGYIPEFIVYSRLLTPLERRKVDTYLAIKYGITIPVSYIGSKDQLLWDYELNPDFNNRITALYRDDASDIYQVEGGTTYEDLPTNTASDDYYYGGNPYDRSSDSRLLNISLQSGNKLNDGSYMFWSDDNKGIKFTPIEKAVGWAMLDRSWLLKTNIIADQSQDLEWNVTDLEYTINDSRKGINIVNKSSLSNPKDGYLISSLPLISDRGAIEVTNLSLSGTLYIKFGSNQPTSTGNTDYGYHVNNIGSIYPIKEGVIGESSVGVVSSGKLEMEKIGNLIYLRKDGVRLRGSEIIINPSHENNQFYAGVFVGGNGLLDSKMLVCHGGFVDTGNKVELSYASNKAPLPSPLAVKEKSGNVYLVIDHSGKGDFSKENAQYIPYSDYDTKRNKYIFENIFFDTDKNNEDMFTFVYRESALAGEVEVEEPSCNEADGAILIKLDGGSPAFEWTLKDLRTGEITKTGTAYSHDVRIDSVRGGEYQVEVKEAGGYTLINKNPDATPNRAKTTNAFPVFQGNIEWAITSTTDTYMIGWTNFTESVDNPKNIIHYGLKKEGNKIYKVVSGKLEETNVTVQEGDVLRIQKEMSKVYYYKNGAQFSSNSIKWYDVVLKFYGLVDMSFGHAEIYNVRAEGFFNLADYNWSYTNDIDLSKGVDAKVIFDVEVYDPCDNGMQEPETPTNSEEIQSTENNSKLKVYGIPGTMEVTARVELEQPQPVSFVVYDMSGNVVKTINKTTSEKVQEVTINVGRKGIFIVKAITPSKDHSAKTLVE